MTNNNINNNSNKLWAGLFDGDTDCLLEKFNSSFSFDFKLWRQDIAGSLAHAEMLCKQNIISQKDWEDIFSGLNKIYKNIESNPEAWFEKNKNSEDIHSAIEQNLTELVGEAGRKLHTARSRNDQVATDLRLWLIDWNNNFSSRLNIFLENLLSLAEKYR